MLEAQRVFADKLISKIEVSKYNKIVAGVFQNKFPLIDLKKHDLKVEVDNELLEKVFISSKQLDLVMSEELLNQLSNISRIF